MLRLSVRLLSVLTLVLSLVACDSGNDPGIPTAPTPPVNVTETFSGSVNQNGAVTHTFNSMASGSLSATLSVLGPDSTQVIGMSLGTLSGTTCTTVLSNDRSTQGTIITGGVSSFAQLCVRAYDIGTITAAAPFTYEITVVHP
jgi:hypothetical protein